MQNSMDLIGQAILDRLNGENENFLLKSGGKIFKHNLSRYLQIPAKLSKSEKKLVSLCYGKILDIGCGTGNYTIELEKKGKVIGIDISDKIIQASKKLGITNCQQTNIFSYNPKTKFDTITLFETNLGIGGTIKGTQQLLEKMEKILNPKGQILAIISNRAKEKNYLQTELTPIYKNQKGETFQRINFNKKYLTKLCQKQNLKLKIISGNRYYSLLQITKI